MEGGTVRYKYTDTALPTSGSTVTLFSTVTTFPYANAIQVHNIHRIYFAIQNDQTGTLKAYKSVDRGVTWVREFDDIAVAAAATNTSNYYDFLVEPYADFKLDWTNGGTGQGTFNINISSTGSRNLAS